MNRHLIAVEVGIERRANKRMDLERAAFDESRLERLNTQAVKRWCAVEHDRMSIDDGFQNVPHLGRTPNLLRDIDRGRLAAAAGAYEPCPGAFLSQPANSIMSLSTTIYGIKPP